jgi:hypothetical protein
MLKWNMLSYSIYTQVAVYFLLSTIILWDLLLPGYIVTLDMPWSPNIKFPSQFYGFETDPISLMGLPFSLIIWPLSFIPSHILQKAVLFLVFFLSGLGAHRLCLSRSQLGKYFAGFLYTLNPFVYVRFMVGHLGLLLAYAVTPFLISSVLNFLEKPNLKRSLTLALLLTLIISLDSHFSMISALVLISLLIFRSISLGLKGAPKLLPWLLIATLAYLIINLYWLLPLLLGYVREPFIEGFTYQDQLAFMSHTWGTGVNIFFSLAALYGFWRPPEAYTYVSQTLLGWQILYILILLLTVYGFTSWTAKTSTGKWMPIGIATVGILCLILATGISSNLTAPIFQFLFEHVPFFSGMREPQKFIALLALTYAVLGGFGLGEISESFKKSKLKWRRSLMLLLLILALTLPFTYSYNQLFGFNGQVESLSYPVEWYEVKAILDGDNSDYTILFFPWHLYMYQSWIGRITANPAPDFFAKPAISGENMEWAGIETQSQKPTQHYIHFLLNHKAEIRSLGQLLAPLNVKYIILLKEVDYQNYAFLYDQEDLEPVHENSKIVLFKNKHPTAKIYLTENIQTAIDWNILLNQPQTITLKPVKYLEISPIEYRIEVKSKGYLVLTEPYDEGWKLNGEKSIANLGLTNAFYVEKPGTYTLRFEKFNLLLTYYMISLISFIVCFIYLIYQPLKKALIKFKSIKREASIK